MQQATVLTVVDPAPEDIRSDSVIVGAIVVVVVVVVVVVIVVVPVVEEIVDPTGSATKSTKSS
jgi:hypothetical protein